MKIFKALELAVAVLCVAASTSAWSQGGDTAGAPASTHGASQMAAPGAAAPVGRKADRALRHKVYAAIGKDKEISAGDIGISAKDGAVTLNGTVTDAAQIGQATVIAGAVPGVTSVINKLTVKKPLGGM